MLSSLILAALPLLASAAPAPEPDFLSLLSKRNWTPGGGSLSVCDISAIKMDSLGLGAPAPGLVLDHIALGRGTQNYTCADSLETTKPVAAGAVAILYNVTCLAGPFAGLLNELPSIALKYPQPTPEQVRASSARDFYLGNHYFTPNATTPFFNLNTEDHEYGVVALGRLDGNDAANAQRDVANLKLGTKSRRGCQVQEVFRLHSAGGQAPKTCKDMPRSFEVQYATNYWFWSNPEGELRTGAYGGSQPDPMLG